MRKSTFSSLLLFGFIAVIALQSCKDDVYLASAPPVPDQSFKQTFDTFQNAYNSGWRFLNRSEDVGPTKWQAGSISGALLPYKSLGTNLGFITTDYQSGGATSGSSIISNWAVSPVITFQNGDKIVFYTICQLYNLGGGDSTDFVNRLQVRLSKRGESLNCGTADNVGDFTENMLDINPLYIEHTISAFDPASYPGTWTRYEVTINGLNGPTKGRFAFRYFLEGGGPAGMGSEVGIDEVTFTSASH